MPPPMPKRPRLERPARVLVGKVFTGGEDPGGSAVWGQLRASSTTLIFDFDDGRPSIYLHRGQVDGGGCLRKTSSKSRNDKHLLRVPLLDGRAPYIFSLASAEAQVRAHALETWPHLFTLHSPLVLVAPYATLPLLPCARLVAVWRWLR